MKSKPMKSKEKLVDEVADDDDNVSDCFEEIREEEIQEIVSPVRKKMLSNAERRAIYDALLERSINGKLKHNTTSIVASLFSMPIRNVQRIWKQGKDNSVDGVIDVSHRKSKNCGRKRIRINVKQIRELLLHKRTTFKSMSCALKYNKTSLYTFYKEGGLRGHSNAIKPYMTEANQKARLRICLSILDRSSSPDNPIFVDMYNIVHIDEKWFFKTKKSEKYILLPDEEDPLRTSKSKYFVTKVMFLAAIARPRFDSEGNEVFSRKIGVFPFITKEQAKRTSVNRVAGTLVTKCMNVDKHVVRAFLIEKILPAIRAKWPSEDSKIQFLYSKIMHVSPNDEEFCKAASQDGFDIRLMCQLANSPDMNVLDLGFFHAIQALQYQEVSNTINELIGAVVKSFDSFSVTKSNRIFLSLQLCMIETMKAKGSIKYKIPHGKKKSLERIGRLPSRMKCTPELVQDVLNQLN